MSWYNENNITDIVDATQEIIGGVGSGGNITIINEGDTTTINNTTGGIEDLIQQVNNDTFIKNINTDGRIYFYVKEADNDSGDNYNTRINKDGNLQYYHSYTLFNPTKFAGWYGVRDGIIGLEATTFILTATTATIQAEILAIEAEDVAYMRAIEADDSSAKSASATKKTALRNAPAASAITNATSIAELKAAWDTDTLGDSPYA